MTNAEDSPPEPDQDLTATNLEGLVARCLLAMETKGDAGLDEFCAEFPQHAEKIREKVGWLRQTGLLQSLQEEPGSIGPYEIEETLGSGGQGTVYLARDTRLSRSVALKVLTASQSADASALGRFRREAEAASRFDHPGICSVYECGEVDGAFFIAMQYVRGQTLAERISANPVDGREISSCRAQVAWSLAYFEQAARALHAAHEAGLVHRDIKPANLMVTVEDQPVILDFGLASVSESDSLTLTRTGDLMGTPAYMSPEQLRDSRGLDHRTDVYSLGAALYECLTGRRPFEGDSREALFRSILQDPVPNPRRANPTISKDLAVVLETVLERDAGRRFPDALALAEELRRVREREPIHARPAGLLLRGWRWCQRNPGLAAAVVILVLALGGGLVGAWFIKQSRQREARAEEAVRLVASAHAELKGHPDLSILLAIEAARLHPGPAANGALLDALLSLREELHIRFAEPGAKPAVPVACVFGPTGKRALVACDDGTARLVDIRTGEFLARFGIPGGAPMLGCDLDADGARALTTAADGEVRLWESSTATLLRSWSVPGPATAPEFSPGGDHASILGARQVFVVDLSGPRTQPQALARTATRLTRWRPDGKAVLLAAVRGAIAEVDSSTGRTLWSTGTEQGRYLGIRYNRDGSRLVGLHGPIPDNVAQGRWATELRVWDTGTRERIATHPVRSHGPVVFVPPDQRVLLPDLSHAIHLIDLATGKTDLILRGHASTVRDLDSAPSGDTLVSVSFDGTFRRWRIGPLRPYPTLRGHTGGITPVSFDQAGERVLSAASDGTARVWDSRTGEPLLVLATHENETVFPARYTPDGSRILTACLDGHVRLFDAVSGVELLRFGSKEEPPFMAAISPDGARVACAGIAGGLSLYDAGSGKLQHKMEGHQMMMYWATFSPDGRWLATACKDGTAALWRVEDGERAHTLGEPGPWASYVVFAPDSKSLLKLRADGTARIFDVQSGVLKLELVGHRDLVWRAAFDPRGKRIATGSRDATVRLWDAATGRQQHLLEGHESMVANLTFSPDGRFLASVGLGGIVQLHDAESGGVIFSKSAGADSLFNLGFSPDGERLAFGAAETIHIWPTDPLAAARARRTRDLEPGERGRFLGK